jgi:hypothetical protein
MIDAGEAKRLRYQIGVMQAYLDGARIEVKRSNGWIPLDGPCWDWVCNEYRVEGGVEPASPSISKDQPVWVQDDGDGDYWAPAHFSHWEDGKPKCFNEGRTSFTTNETVTWDKIRLSNGGDLGVDHE